MVDYVRGFTGQDKIAYIGHSQGTTQMFSALSENKGDLKRKINAFIALAPVMNLGNTQDEFLLMLSKNVNSYHSWLDFFGITEFFGANWSYVSAAFCYWNQDFCRTASGFEEL